MSKRCILTFVVWRGVLLAIAIIAGGALAPAYCQTSDVALLLQQTPDKGGVTTPVSGIYHFAPNSEVTLSAIPSPGYQFVYWLGDVSDPTASSTVAYLDKSKVVIAVFEQVEFSILDVADSAPVGVAGGGGLIGAAADYGQSSGFSGGGAPGGQKPLSSQGSDSIPEPATGVLLVLGSLFVFSRRGAKRQA